MNVKTLIIGIGLLLLTTAAEAARPTKAEFVVCNKSSYQMKIHIVSVRLGHTDYFQSQDLAKDQCAETGLLGARIIYFSVMYRMSEDSEYRLFRPSASVRDPETYTNNIVHRYEAYTYHEVYCVPVDENRTRGSRLRTMQSSSTLTIRKVCLPDEKLRLFNFWAAIPLAHFTLSL
jgi:hypothetical protein